MADVIFIGITQKHLTYTLLSIKVYHNINSEQENDMFDIEESEKEDELEQDPKINTLSTLEKYGMEWCFGAIYSMRKKLADRYINSIKNGIHCLVDDYIDMNEYCNELINTIGAAERQNISLCIIWNVIPELFNYLIHINLLRAWIL
eukprot:30625_1